MQSSNNTFLNTLLLGNVHGVPLNHMDPTSYLAQPTPYSVGSSLISYNNKEYIENSE